MRALGATVFAAPDHLFAQADVRGVSGFDGTRPLQLGLSKDLETSKSVFVEILDRVQQVAVQR